MVDVVAARSAVANARAEGAPGLRLRGVVVEYEAASRRDTPVRAVDEVSLDLPHGQVLALLGPSGCGKSSLLRAIAGLERSTGEISWGGRSLAGLPVHERGIGLMFQDGQLFPHRDVAGNVAYGLEGRALRGGRRERVPAARRRARVAELLDAVGLAGYETRQVSTLSGGERQRVALARSLAPAPGLLLLDEPLSALDRELRERLAVDLRVALLATGTTAVFVTHDQDEAFALADRVAILADGRLLQFDTPENLWSRPASAEVATFLGYSTFLTRTDADALGLGHLTADHVVALGPESLTVDPAGLQLRVKEQKVRRGYVQVTLLLPSGAKAGLRVPEKVSAATVGVRTDPDAVALIG